MKYRILKSQGLFYIQHEVEFYPLYPFFIMPFMLIWSLFNKSVLAKQKRWEFYDNKLPFETLDGAKERIFILDEPDEIIDL